MYNFYKPGEAVEKWSSLGEGVAWEPEAHLKLSDEVFEHRFFLALKEFMKNAVFTNRGKAWTTI